MTPLILGLLLFFVPHLLVGTPPMVRLKAAIGEGPYKGLFSLLSVAGLGLMIWAMPKAPDGLLWYPPLWTRHIAPLLMLLSCYLILASVLGGKITARTAHPQSLGILCWASAHLLANGEENAFLLFGSFALYSLISIWRQDRRGVRARLRRGRLGSRHELWLAMLALGLYLTLLAAHPHLFGAALA
ncbi:NnrU family protein [Ferrimonas marina]|uniref:NnrU protein n=1 Tax=Ferrimonas marina TaxID=299255 RepID=A0A1M5ZB54_9GAMM|nr:NnrU family protein [Ferrimonas marina]SHI21368.1 NnrU protein [Ferrimonas marina]